MNKNKQRKFKILFLVFIGFLMLVSCTKLPLYQSKWNDNTLENNQGTYRYFDPGSNLKFDISNDDKNLYLKLSTIDRSTQMKILHAGFKIYFDTLGKKKNTAYLNFPIKSQRPDLTNDNSQKMKVGGDQIKSIQLKNLIKKIPQTAKFSNYRGSTSFHHKLDETNIKINLEEDIHGFLVYEVAIPLGELKEGSLVPEDEISIGFVSGVIGMQSRESSSSPSAKGGGRGGGGGRAPGGKMGQGGVRSGGGERQTGSMQKMAEPIKVWFRIKMAENK